MDNLQSFFPVISELSLKAGAIVRRHYHSPVEFERKEDDSPVTKADREVELFLRESLERRYPDHSILGEEFGETSGTSGYRWILDPIDGTKSFISGVPLYGTLVGIEFEGRSQIGVIFIPGLNECVFAARGQGAWYERGVEAPVAAQVSKRAQLNDALCCTSDVGTTTPSCLA